MRVHNTISGPGHEVNIVPNDFGHTVALASYPGCMGGLGMSLTTTYTVVYNLLYAK